MPNSTFTEQFISIKFHYFTACQCNGHSNCTLRRRSLEWNIEERSCTQCDHNTTGEHCQFCADGFYGDPRNGGRCEGLVLSFWKLSAFAFKLFLNYILWLCSIKNDFADASSFLNIPKYVNFSLDEFLPIWYLRTVFSWKISYFVF